MGRKTPCCHPNCNDVIAARLRCKGRHPRGFHLMLRKRKSKQHLPLSPTAVSLKNALFAVSFIIAFILYNNLPKIARGNLKSGGVDFKSAESLGFKTVLASGLPGKYMPVSAGEILFRCIRQELIERGYEI